MVFTFPLTGLFNILIYTRPQVVAYRRLHRDTSWPVALWRVLRKPGVKIQMLQHLLRTPPAGRSPKCCKHYFCFGKREKTNGNVPSGTFRLRLLREDRMPPPTERLRNDGIQEPGFSESSSMEHRISMISDRAEPKREQGCNDRSDSPSTTNSKKDVIFLSAQKDAISKVFEKASSQRARTMNEVDFCATGVNACSDMEYIYT
jgi:hypothetical protein